MAEQNRLISAAVQDAPEPLRDQLGDGVDDLLRSAARNEEEIAVAVHRLQHRHLPLVDPVGVDHDQAALGLAKDLVEAHYLDGAGAGDGNAVT